MSAETERLTEDDKKEMRQMAASILYDHIRYEERTNGNYYGLLVRLQATEFLLAPGLAKLALRLLDEVAAGGCRVSAPKETTT